MLIIIYSILVAKCVIGPFQDKLLTSGYSAIFYLVATGILVTMLKGILSWSAHFLYVKELFLLSSETYFYHNPRFPSTSKLAKTENPGTSSALKSGYPEEYCALKTCYWKGIVH